MRRALGSVIAIALAACGSAADGVDGSTPSTDAGPADAPIVPRDGGPYVLGDAGMPAEVEGCDGASLLAVPDEPEARGPWAVGARTVTIGDLRTEIWYPVDPAESVGATSVVYDLREWLSPGQRTLLPDDDNPWQRCDCARDLPIDAAHGPYPVIVFVHGTAAFRTQSLSTATHWASRGFVVVASDHPGLFLAEVLATVGGCADEPSRETDLAGDVERVIDALGSTEGELAFLAGRIDAGRIGLAGHSAGGAVASMTSLPGVRAIASLAGAQPAAESPSLASSLFVAADADRVVPPMRSLDAYLASPTPRRFLSIAGSGHLAPSDLCDLVNTDGQNLIEVAAEHRICGAVLGRALFDCEDEHVAPEVARTVVDAITTAVFEETLTCRDRAAAITALPARLEAIGELREE